MLKKLSARSDRFDADVQIAEGSSSRTAVTVVVGPNGSRKSFLLRLICYAAFGRPRHIRNNETISIEAEWEDNVLPRQLVCFSSTPYDRFPSLRPGHSSVRKDGTTLSYHYIGWRASQRPPSARNSDRELAWALLRNGAARKRNKPTLEAAFRHIGFTPKLYVYLEPGAKLRNLFPEREIASARDPRKAVERALKAFLTAARRGTDYPELSADIAYLDSKNDAEMRREISEKVLELLTADAKPPILLDADRTRRLRGSLRNTTWKALIAIGVVDVSRTEFVPLGHSSRRIPSSHLSSGQWNWLSTFCGICTTIGNDSLILIDEPENSLHPQWQRNYMQSLDEAIQGYERCQIIVATHSPFIAAGLKPDAGDVVRLVPSLDTNGKTTLHDQTVPSLFGWRATDVYEEAFQIESTRDERFLEEANHALAAIRDGGLPTEEDVQTTVEKLRDDEQRLPDNDPMKAVLKSIQDHLTVKPS